MKNILYSTFIILFTLTFSSCVKEELEFEPDDTKVIVLPNGKLRIPLQINLPTANEVTTRTVPTPKELEIANLYVLIWEANSSGSFDPGAKLLQIQKVTISSTGSSFVDLDPYAGVCVMRAFANLSANLIAEINAYKTVSSHGINATTIEQNLLMKDDLGALYKNNPGVVGSNGEQLNNPYPMATDGEWLEDGINKTTAIQLNLNACYARITVDASSLNPISQFDLQGAQLVSGAKYGYYRPQVPLPYNDAVDGVEGRKDIRVPYTNTVGQFISNNMIYRIYLYANNGKARGSDIQGTNPTELIISGYYVDPDKNKNTHKHIGYHKIVIRYKDKGSDGLPTGEYRYDIERNTLYTVKITEVRSAGYATPEEALASRPANQEELVYDIVVNESDKTSHDIITGNGDYYMGFSNTASYFYGSPNIETGLESEYEVDITTLTVGLNSGVTTMPQAEIESHDPRIEILSNINDLQNGVSKIIKAKIKGFDVDGKVCIKVGNLRQIITVKSFPYVKAMQVTNMEVQNTLASSVETGIDFVTLSGGSVSIALNSTFANRYAKLFFLRDANKGRLKIEIAQASNIVLKRAGDNLPLSNTIMFKSEGDSYKINGTLANDLTYTAEGLLSTSQVATSGLNYSFVVSPNGANITMKSSVILPKLGDADRNASGNITLTNLAGESRVYNFSSIQYGKPCLTYDNVIVLNTKVQTLQFKSTKALHAINDKQYTADEAQYSGRNMTSVTANNFSGTADFTLTPTSNSVTISAVPDLTSYGHSNKTFTGGTVTIANAVGETTTYTFNSTQYASAYLKGGVYNSNTNDNSTFVSETPYYRYQMFSGRWPGYQQRTFKPYNLRSTAWSDFSYGEYYNKKSNSGIPGDPNKINRDISDGLFRTGNSNGLLVGQWVSADVDVTMVNAIGEVKIETVRVKVVYGSNETPSVN